MKRLAVVALLLFAPPVFAQTPAGGYGPSSGGSGGVSTTADATFGAHTYDFSGATLLPPSTWFQTNSSANASQAGLNFVNTSGASGINFTNGATNQVSASLASVAGGGTSVLQATLTSIAQKDFVCANGSSVLVNCTPGVAFTDKSTVNTTSYNPVSLDRGNIITRKAAGAMSDLLAQANSAGFASNWFTLLCNVDTVNSDTVTATTSTINGIAGATGIVVTPNTCGNVVSDNTNYRFTGFNWTVPGTGIDKTYNANGSTSLSLLGAGSMTTNVLQKWNGTQLVNSLHTDDGTTDTYTGTGGTKSPAFTTTGTTAGFVDLPQGSTSAAVAPCNTATSICEQAPAAVTSYLVTKPGVSASGLVAGTVAAAVVTQNFTGSSAFHAGPVTIGSGSSISATSLCSTTNCPAGDYDVAAYVEITTACTTTGSYIVWLGWTDDGSAKTGSSTTTFFPFPLNGSGVPTTVGTIVPAAAGNYAQAHIFLHTTGAATSSLGSINYGTTAGACGSGGPMVGKLFLTVVPLS